MTDEIKVEQEEKCFCKSKGFRKFVVVALGSFVGVYCALSLFCAIHKPPIPNHHQMGPHHHIGAPMPPQDFQRGPQAEMFKNQNHPPKMIKEGMVPNGEFPKPEKNSK